MKHYVAKTNRELRVTTQLRCIVIKLTQIQQPTRLITNRTEQLFQTVTAHHLAMYLTGVYLHDVGGRGDDPVTLGAGHQRGVRLDQVLHLRRPRLERAHKLQLRGETLPVHPATEARSQRLVCVNVWQK